MAGPFRFGDFELDVAAFALRREGTPVRLEKIPMELLILLVEHDGKLVARDSIHAALWGSDVFLDRDAAINTAMRKIRKVLGDDADRPQFVETVVGNNNLIVHQLLEQQATRFPVLVTLFRRTNNVIIASFRSRNGEALKVAEKFQGGGHANAAGATLPKSVRTITDAMSYLRQVLNPKREAPLNSLENLFNAIDLAQK